MKLVMSGFYRDMKHKPRSEGFSPGNDRKAFHFLIDINVYSFAKIWVFFISSSGFGYILVVVYSLA